MDLPGIAPAPTPTPAVSVPAPTPAGGGGVPPASGLPGAGGVLHPQPAPAPAPAPVDPAALQRQVQELQALNEQFRTQYQQQEQLAAYGRQVLAQQQQAQFQQGQPQAQPQPANPFGVSAWDSRLEVFLTRDAAGNIVEKPGAPPGTAAQFMAHEQSTAAALRRIVTNPGEALAPIIQQMVAQQAAQAAQQAVSSNQQAQAGEQWIASNANWLYQFDAGGRIMTDLAGQRVFSDYGKAFAQYAHHAKQAGVQSLTGQIEFAMNSLQAAVAQQQFGTQRPAQPVQQPLNPQQTALLQKLNFLQQAAAPNPGLPGGQQVPAARPGQAPVPPPVPGQLNKTRSFKDFFAAKMANGQLQAV